MFIPAKHKAVANLPVRRQSKHTKALSKAFLSCSRPFYYMLSPLACSPVAYFVL